MTSSAPSVLDDAPASASSIDIDAVVSKVTRRLIPFLVVCYIAAYIDRVNIGFAALSMNKDLGFSPTIFGWGAGIFFLGYALFEVPSNLILHRVGARRWIARIMVSWGIVSGLMAMAWDATSFVVLRFLLGLAEAGFAPGILLYLTYWVPEKYRARSLAAFLVGIPLSTIIGAPISGILLGSMQGVAGLANWQWLFILEAIPSICLGIIALLILTDRPADAAWLTTAERIALQANLESEQAQRRATHDPTALGALRHPRVIVLSLAYFGIVTALYGLGFWLPQMIDAFGAGPVGTGFLTALPYTCGAVTMVVWSRSADRSGTHARYTVAACGIAALGLAASAFVEAPTTLMLSLVVASVGTLAIFPVFWALPTTFLSSAAAATGIALVNSIGNLAGFAGPYFVGWVKETSGAYSWALLALALGPLFSALLILGWKPSPKA
jgi:ACS family tartrate transporter-like MFS transporter